MYIKIEEPDPKPEYFILTIKGGTCGSTRFGLRDIAGDKTRETMTTNNNSTSVSKISKSTSVQIEVLSSNVKNCATDNNI